MKDWRVRYPVISQLKNGIIISCQADAGEPLAKPSHIKALALSAIKGGAKGLRLEGAENIKAIRKHTDLPIIGLIKCKRVSKEKRLDSVYITSSFKDAKQLSNLGCDIIAIDATGRQRADGLSLAQTIERIHNELDKPVWADIATVEEGLAAEAAGADIISTTLFGYTTQTKLADEEGPDLNLVEKLAKKAAIPVILEGRVWQLGEVTKAFSCGAYAVVIGSAITRPQLITARFVRAIPKDRFLPETNG